jgi:hypothetical protein
MSTAGGMIPRMNRYTSEPRKPLNFSRSGAFGSEAEKPRKASALEEFLRLGAVAAPAVGAVGGGVIGALAGGGVGAAPGAAIGGAAGMGAGALMGYGAEKMAEGDTQAEEARMRREAERQARQQAAMQMLGGL